ncbi:MAG: nitrite/sulfite reductase [Pseudomonadota bacterium]
MSVNTNNLADLEEIDYFERSLNAFQAGEMDADRFTAIRLQQGVYGQRQEGVNMVRVKIPGGRLAPQHLAAIADVVEQYSQHDVAHITTRQDLQVHFIPLPRMPAALRRLADAGLTSREACGNTVRNMTACALAGVCPREHTDINRHLDGAVLHFLRNPLNQQMPRKFKISFSGCEADCAQSMLHDLGVIAVRQIDGSERFGFKIVAGGGLGHKPHEAITVESFIEEKDLLLAMEALVTLHNKYSDRTKRAKSRIKFLVDRFGAEGFVEKYREEFARTKEALAQADYPKGEWRAGRNSEPPGPGAPRRVFAQKQSGLFVVPVSVTLGDLSSAQLRGLAALLERHGLDDVRATQDQNLMLVNVAQHQTAQIYAELAQLGLRTPQAGDNVVACPGTSTCRLGITSSTIVAPKLSGGPNDLRIRVSGCHNGCAQPETGDIGIYGEGRRLHGKLVPHYQMYFGGNGMAGGGLAIKGPSVPAVRVEQAIARVQGVYATTREDSESFFAWTRRRGALYIAELLADLVEVKEADLQSVLRDHGVQSDFKVLQLGGGECAGATQVQIGAAFFDAAHERNYRNALLFQRKYEEAAQCALVIFRLIGHGLSQLLGGRKPDDFAELAQEIKRVAPMQGRLGARMAELAGELAKPADELNEALLTPLFKQQDAWTLEVADFCLRHDRQLDLTGALPPKAQVIQFDRGHKTAAGAV